MSLLPYCFLITIMTLLLSGRQLMAGTNPPSNNYLRSEALLEGEEEENTNNHQCTTKCGSFRIPFPFYLNASSSSSSSCGGSLLSDAFFLSCVNSSSLFLNIAAHTYRVLRFFPDGVLVDFPNNSACRQYNDLLSFPFSGNSYFGISSDNVLDLYGCEDSSLCRPDCERSSLPVAPGGAGCQLARNAAYPSCCYPLSDPSAWRPGDSFSHFTEYGCRGFSSWVNLPGTSSLERGVKLEWAVPRNLTQQHQHLICAANAAVFNATSVASGIRCQCPDGFVGDGFADGSGCIKSCLKDDKEAHGNNCFPNDHSSKKATILAGVITSAFTAVSLLALFCILRRRIRSVSDQAHHQQSSLILSEKASCRSRLFAYNELEEATKRFEDEEKIVDDGCVTRLYGGSLAEGSRVAVQRFEFDGIRSEREVMIRMILFRLEALSAVSHKNMARILGWSIDSTPLVVYEYPENGTLEQHLHRACRYHDQEQMPPLDWYKRLNIAAETATVLSFLHHEISPPIFHHDLQLGCIFLDEDFSVKLAGFEMMHYSARRTAAGCNVTSCTCSCRKNDVCSLGVLLLQIITGNTRMSFCGTSDLLEKIKSGKLEEMVDPSLYYHEQPTYRKEQIEIIADLATRCLLFGAHDDSGTSVLRMADVTKELVHITKLHTSNTSVVDHRRRGPATVTATATATATALEETFSNSSLLQMISMSPDHSSSIYLPPAP